MNRHGPLQNGERSNMHTERRVNENHYGPLRNHIDPHRNHKPGANHNDATFVFAPWTPENHPMGDGLKTQNLNDCLLIATK